MPSSYYSKLRQRKPVGRLQLAIMRCFWAADGAPVLTRDIASWCWPMAVELEDRRLRLGENTSMNRAARSIGAKKVRRVGRQWLWILPADPDDPWSQA
jgi:hypothetical protein